ncbi:MAG: LysR family transcriptional regulator [Enterococcus sp.]|jgi:DNA-binding transcriptional LysR family regulator|nr:LysR family transcriptional regulator [Enterococcus sp.]
MNIQQCRYVVAIAKAGSFSEAAKQLYVTQPSLSSAVKDLEEELAVQLFIRSKSGVNLTEEGVDFLVYANRILDQVDLLETHFQANYKKDFTITTQRYDFLSQPFLKVMHQFKEEYQNFHLVETTTLKNIESVRDFKSELGILYLNKDNRRVLERYFQQEELDFEPLGQFQTQIFLKKDHPLAFKKIIYPQELLNYPQVRFSQEDQTAAVFNEDPIEAFDHQPVMYTNDRGTLMNLLCESDAYASGLGIVDSFINEHIVLRPLADATTHTLGIITNKKRKLTPIAKKFIEEVKETLAKRDNGTLT